MKLKQIFNKFMNIDNDVDDLIQNFNKTLNSNFK